MWLGGLCMPVYLSVWVWGKITEERTAQEVLKFKILLANFGSGGWGCLWNWTWIPFSSNSYEWVPWTRFHSQNLEHLNRRKCRSSLNSCFLLLASRWSTGEFPPKNLRLRFVCFVFVFIWRPHGKGLLNSFLCELPLCSVKSFFFHDVVSYIFIKPHHIFFTVQLLKGCYQVGQLMKF